MNSYLKLVHRFPLESIKNEKHLEEAMVMVDLLINKTRDKGEEEYLDALSDLIFLFEEENYPF